MRVVDYSTGRPGAAAIRAAGYVGAVRRIGDPGQAQSATRDELDDFTAVGLGLALVHDRSADDWRGGYPAGHAAATVARTHASAIGFPGDRPIYLSVHGDVTTPTDFAAVRDYLRGAVDVMGVAGTGVYANRDVATMARGARVASYVWHHPGATGDHPHLHHLADAVVINGVTCGVSVANETDWGQHNVNARDHSAIMIDAMVTAAQHLSDDAVRRLAAVYVSELARRRTRGLIT